MRTLKFIFAASVFVAGSLCASGAAEMMENKVAPVREPLPITNVRLTSGPLMHAQEMDKAWLNSMETDRYLSGFRSQAGLEPKAQRYGGWESAGCSGHCLGHFLSATSMMYAATGDHRMLEKVEAIVDGLAECQDFENTGLIAGFERSRELFEEIRRGDIRSSGFDLNGGWVPFYTLHKEMAGLVDACRYCPGEVGDKAKTVLVRFADWMYELVRNLDDSQMARILNCEQGGITESLADVYALTGDVKYLELAKKFNHEYILRPLAAGIDSLPGKHANTQIPKIVGAVREYECSGEQRYRDIAEFFWDRVVNHHSYVIGGNSEYEHFGAPDMLSPRLSDGNCETCNTYNMLKLTEHLYALDPQPKYVEYYERAMYNQILASQNPNDGMVCYMSPMGSGFRKGFSTPYDSFWCCVGSGMENHTKYGKFIYSFSSDDEFYVNLFVPSTADWNGIHITQETAFPYSDEIIYRISAGESRKFSLNLRLPNWCGDGCTLEVNGKPVPATAGNDGFIRIERKWKSGDIVRFVLDPVLRSEPILGDESVRAYIYGPIVLAAVLADNEEIPVIVADKPEDAASCIRLKDRSSLKFETVTARPVQKELIPYFELINRRMMLYFNHYPSATWKEQLAEYRARADKEKWMREYTVSQFTPGQMQPERDHNFKGEKTQAHEFQGRHYRETLGGWFSFDMDVDPVNSNTIYCTYWGNRFENHSFDILVDGIKVGFENIHNWGSQYVERKYPVPANLTKGKKTVTITLKAVRDDAVAGPLFDVRVMRDTK